MKKPAPLSLMERVAQLPPPQPGKQVSIPIELFPAWLKAHNREIVRFDEKRFIHLGQQIMPLRETHEKSQD